MKFLRKIFSFFICLAGVLLPHRARIIYSELLGWLVQFVYMNYIYILKYLLASLSAAGEKKEGGA